MNHFKINKYEDSFIRFHVTILESIYFFVEFCKANPIWQSSIIPHPTEILVGKSAVLSFEDFCLDLEITFCDENGHFVVGENLLKLENAYSNAIDFIRLKRQQTMIKRN